MRANGDKPMGKQDHNSNGGDHSHSRSPAGSARWGGSTGEIDSETYELVELVENGWAWQWPGWAWVAKILNHWHKQDRSPNACRLKYNTILSQNVKVYHGVKRGARNGVDTTALIGLRSFVDS